MGDTHAEQLRRENNVFIAFWSAFAIGVVGLAMFGLASENPAKVFALGILVGSAAALIGALLGFLFGLPRGATGDDRKPNVATSKDTPHVKGAESDISDAEGTHIRRGAYVNNNLLEISDWLTKIIVGAGLVSLKDLVAWVGSVGQLIGDGAGFNGALARVFGCSVVTFFFAWGFLYVYIQTRTIISFVFASMERSLQDLGTTIRDAVATEVRENVMPQIERVSENTILQLLYSGERGAARAVADRAREFLRQPGNESNGRVWLYLACAYGQQHAVAIDDSLKASIADRAYDALSRALKVDLHLHGLARGLLYVEDPQHLPGDDDLVTFRDDPRFQELVGPPPITDVGKSP